MDKVIKQHHSLGDWDFDPQGRWHYDPLWFISPPTSLYTPFDGSANGYNWLFLKAAIGPDIKEGRIVTYERHRHPDYPWKTFYYRVQALPSPNLPANGYGMMIGRTEWQHYEYVAGVENMLAFGPLTYTRLDDRWYQQRLTFFTFTNVDEQIALRSILETKIGGEWVEQGSHDIINPRWQDSHHNLVGFRLQAVSVDAWHHLDNTEIWEKTE